MKTSDITNLVSKTTKKWAKQRKAEERSSRAASRRRHMYSDRVCATDVAHEILPGAYAHAAGPTGLHVSQRQLFYAARNQFLEETGRELDFKYFTAKILRKYLQRSDTQHWKITRDPRGNLREPHTDRTIPLGTLLVDDYLAKLGWSEEEKPEGLQILLPTTGPENRYRALLYLEKEGFNPLLEQVQLAERFDIAVMSCKGQSVIAARKLVDRICGKYDIPLFVLHDFDKFGFSIFQCLHSVSGAARSADTVAYRFKNSVRATDLGLRLADVEKWDLESEPCRFTGGFDYADRNILPEEKEFLEGGERVELNMFSSPEFVEFVEDKLRNVGGLTEKLIPGSAALLKAFARARSAAQIKLLIDQEWERLKAQEQSAQLPETLRDEIRKYLIEHPERPWDAALFEIVDRQVREAHAKK